MFPDELVRAWIPLCYEHDQAEPCSVCRADSAHAVNPQPETTTEESANV